VIIAGDICEGLADGVRWIAEQGLNAKPVIYVPGNHEYYCHDIDEELAAGRAAADTHANIHLLDEEGIVVAANGECVRISGATLWTDYEYFGVGERDASMGAAATLMNDHRLIRVGARTLRPGDCLQRFESAHAWLKRMMEICADLKRAKRIDAHVVVTHHAVSEKSVAKIYKLDRLTPAFASRLDRLVSKADLWVHGHVHHQSRYQLGRAQVVVNARGYVSHEESNGFDPSLVVEVDRRKPRRQARQRPTCTSGPVEQAKIEEISA
jgi:Icc-related predicted phosphoesterase